jgi:hypothetical protein
MQLFGRKGDTLRNHSAAANLQRHWRKGKGRRVLRLTYAAVQPEVCVSPSFAIPLQNILHGRTDRQKPAK